MARPKKEVRLKKKFEFTSNKKREKVSNTTKRTIKKRTEKMSEAASFLEEKSKEGPPGICGICGDFMERCLDGHHPYTKAVNPHCKVTICGSCHRIFDKGGGLDELKTRRQRYWIYNLKLREKEKVTSK